MLTIADVRARVARFLHPQPYTALEQAAEQLRRSTETIYLLREDMGAGADGEQANRAPARRGPRCSGVHRLSVLVKEYSAGLARCG
jgi:hypothetical protein